MTAPETMDIPDLRKDHERLKKKVQFYETQELDRQLSAIGLERDRGLGKAIATGFKGELEDGAVAAFAKEEYDYTYKPPAPDAEAPVETETAPEVPTDTRARQLIETQRPVDATMAASAPVQPTSLADRIMVFDQKAGQGQAEHADAVASIEDKLAYHGMSQP